MTPDKQRRVATAVGFLSGMLAVLDGMRDAKVFWPPEVVWTALRGPQPMEVGGGVALMVIALLVSVLPRAM